jgi:hypothetical protein
LASISSSPGRYIDIPPEIYFDLLRPRLFIYTGDRGAEIALQFVSLKTSPPRQTTPSFFMRTRNIYSQLSSPKNVEKKPHPTDTILIPFFEAM